MMDELQKQPQDGQLDPQMVSTVTAAVLQTLQATGKLSDGNASRPAQQEVKTIDLIGLFFAILEKFWLVAICAIIFSLGMGSRALRLQQLWLPGSKAQA